MNPRFQRHVWTGLGKRGGLMWAAGHCDPIAAPLLSPCRWTSSILGSVEYGPLVCRANSSAWPAVSAPGNRRSPRRARSPPPGGAVSVLQPVLPTLRRGLRVASRPIARVSTQCALRSHVHGDLLRRRRACQRHPARSVGNGLVSPIRSSKIEDPSRMMRENEAPLRRACPVRQALRFSREELETAA